MVCSGDQLYRFYSCEGTRAHARTLHVTNVRWPAAGDLFSNLFAHLVLAVRILSKAMPTSL